MANYSIEGVLGSGKSLVAVRKAREYMREYRRVATNLDLFLEKLLGPESDYRGLTRLPDWPCAADLHALGRGYEGKYDESKFGALILDEMGTWLNSRAWGDRGRQELINWFLHARKLGWNVYFIAQNLNMLDKQIAASLIQFRVLCKRTDSMKLPLLGIKFPRVHIGFVKYGVSPGAPTVEKWVYRGSDVLDAYDTRQAFVAPDLDPHTGISSMLPARSVTGARAATARARLKAWAGFHWSHGLVEVFPRLWPLFGYSWEPRNEPMAPLEGPGLSHLESARQKRVARLRAIPDGVRWALFRDFVERGWL